MKNLIVTRADDSIREMSDITHPIIKQYAKKCDADFYILNKEPPTNTFDNHPHFRIMEVYDLYEKYERILVLDSDILINPVCPNLFDMVPVDHIGSIFEDIGSRLQARRNTIMESQKLFPDIGWTKGYINTGVFMTSKCHREIFTPIDGKYYVLWGCDDIHLGYQINKMGFPIFELPYQFNHMSMFSEAWNGHADRFNSYIIHYAGAGGFDASSTRIQNILNDKKVWYK